MSDLQSYYCGSLLALPHCFPPPTLLGSWPRPRVRKGLALPPPSSGSLWRRHFCFSPTKGTQTCICRRLAPGGTAGRPPQARGTTRFGRNQPEPDRLSLMLAAASQGTAGDSPLPLVWPGSGHAVAGASVPLSLRDSSSLAGVRARQPPRASVFKRNWGLEVQRAGGWFPGRQAPTLAMLPSTPLRVGPRQRADSVSDALWIRFGSPFILSPPTCRSALSASGKGAGRTVWLNAHLLDKRVRFARLGGCWLEANDLGSSGSTRVEPPRHQGDTLSSIERPPGSQKPGPPLSTASSSLTICSSACLESRCHSHITDFLCN